MSAATQDTGCAERIGLEDVCEAARSIAGSLVATAAPRRGRELAAAGYRTGRDADR